MTVSKHRYLLLIAVIFASLNISFNQGTIQPALQNKKSISENMTTENILELPVRSGHKPRTTVGNPHMQLSQQPEDRKIIDTLMEWAFSLPEINKQFSKVSVPGAEAMCLSPDKMCNECRAFMIENEFAHFHPDPDGSMHLGLTLKDAQYVMQQGWGELHPVAKMGYLTHNFIMVFAPRNEEEVEVVKKIIKRSYLFATGKLNDN
jgi:PIN domain nuclease of toxin-antitoxin system